MRTYLLFGERIITRKAVGKKNCWKLHTKGLADI